MYIYKLGTECDGAQMQVSDVYVPTLVALLGLCFDPSECFRDLRIWSEVVGNKSGKLWYMSWIVTRRPNVLWRPPMQPWRNKNSGMRQQSVSRRQPLIKRQGPSWMFLPAGHQSV